MSTATILKRADSIAIGGFDGMHLGHQKLFSHLGSHGAIVVIETGYANLTPKNTRELYSAYPLRYFELESIRELDGKEFVALLHQEFPSLSKIVVGYDFHFGKNRKFTHKDLSKIFRGELVVVDEVCLHGDSIHSHKIRAKLQIGDIKGANAFLGHNYSVRGAHIKGQGIGKEKLFATINLDVKEYLLPKEGVYATLTKIDNEERFASSVTFVGHRVSTDGSFALETHLIDSFDGDCCEATVSFVSYLRANEKFNSLAELKKAIQRDIHRASLELKHLQL